MITRRGFFGLLGGALAAEAAQKIYVLPPAGGWSFKGGIIVPGEALYFYTPADGWAYRYAYRNDITGHVSDATPDVAQLLHTFAYPERDVVDIYRQMQDGDFQYSMTLEGYKG
jgi:hypothetical protein